MWSYLKITEISRSRKATGPGFDRMGCLAILWQSSDDAEKCNIGAEKMKRDLWTDLDLLWRLFGSGEWVTTDSVGRKERMMVQLEAMKLVVRPVQHYGVKWYSVKTIEQVDSNLVILLELYLCNVLGSEDMLVERHDDAVERP